MESVGNAALSRLLRAKDNKIIRIDEQGHIAASSQTAGGGPEKVEQQRLELIETFAHLVGDVHGSAAGKAARNQLGQHPAGMPLYVRQAKIVIKQSEMWAANHATFEKLALRGVMPMFHEEARKILDEEMTQNADAGTRVLNNADHTSMLEAVEEKLKALQGVATSLPNRVAVEKWAGTAKNSMFGAKSYHEILDCLDICNTAVNDVQWRLGDGQDITLLKEPLDQLLTSFEHTLRQYCNNQSHNRRPEMQALLAHVDKLKHWMKTEMDQPVAVAVVLDLDELRRGLPNPLGSGAFNTVELVWYELDGVIRQGVFKPNNSAAFPPDARDIGIDPFNPRWPERNVASYRLAKALGLDVIPPTYFAKLNGQQGVLMDRAAGYSPLATGPVNIPLTEDQGRYVRRAENAPTIDALVKEQGFESFKFKGRTLILIPPPAKKDGKLESIIAVNVHDKVFQREATKLNWLDLFLDQVDRHGHNYFIERDANGNVAHVQGIDNDLCFGTLKLPNSKATNFPGAIDRALFNKFMKLTAYGVRNQLKGLLTDEEIAARVERLKEIQTILSKYESEGRVLENHEWGTPKSAQLLGIPDMNGMDPFARQAAFNKAEFASYVARQAAYQQRPHAPVLHLDAIQAHLKQIT